MATKRMPHYFRDFKCSGSDCGNNCCIGWEIDIDDETYEFYKSVDGEFGKRLADVIAQSEENSFILNNNRCPFLNDNNLCDIFINLGEEHLCTICTEYPRFTEIFGSLTEVGLGMSCETAARLILGDSRAHSFITEETKENKHEIIDEAFLKLLIIIRHNIINLLQNRDINLRDRIYSTLVYAELVQKHINNNRYDDIPKLSPDILHTDYSICTKDLKNCIRLCSNLEIMEDSWIGVIENTLVLYGADFAETAAEFGQYISRRVYEYEHILVYFVYRYLLKAVFDYDVLSKIKFAVSSYIIVKQLDIAKWIENGKTFSFEDRIKNCVLYSKEVEHCQDNIDFFSEEFIFNEIFRTERMKNML